MFRRVSQSFLSSKIGVYWNSGQYADDFSGAPVRAPKAVEIDPAPHRERIMYNLWNAWGHSMSWTAHYYDRRLNRVAVSRVFASKEDALRQACDLMMRKCVVRFVAGPNDERLDAVAITK